jgi:2-polyprenyl-3-methyl-5-hydroxy-6-metoxy-1,4-benzoquinol methylase/uncharacterized protein YbaR (Trm112 family)
LRETLIPILRCPACGAEGRWSLEAETHDDREIREGELTCDRCGVRRGVRDGIVDLLERPPGFVAREAAGLGRFAELMRADGWDRRRILELPDVDLPYWHGQASSMKHVLDGVGGVDLSPGRRILDVGANTCWASAMLASRGLEVVALDIAVHEMQGLKTADWWFEDKDIYFERVLSVMFDVALASGSFDLIWCCEVLHHNHRSNLRQTLGELHRLLKPGGQLMIVNEPVRALRSPKLHPGAEVAQFEGHEHAYLRRGYVSAARAAGFEINVLGPSRLGWFGPDSPGAGPPAGGGRRLRTALTHAGRRRARLRRAYLAWKTYVDGVPLHMLATKAKRPSRS